jgi:hypothetical protein
LKRFAPLDLLVKLDSLAQLTGNTWQLTPSVFVGAHALGDTPPPARMPFSAARPAVTIPCPTRLRC